VFLHMDGGLMQVCTVMEFCRSGDLAQHLLTLKEGSETVDERRGMSWMFQLCEALSYLHQRKVVHRDLKPANVFLHLISRTDMALKVGDFGLAATLEAGKRTSRVGTPCYLAPEILFNEEYGDRVDIWGAGCIFYEMLTLDFLWERRGMLGVTVQNAPMTAAAIPSRVSYGLRSVVAACLAFKGSTRPSARNVCDAIRSLSQGKPFEFETAVPANDEDWAAPLFNFFNPFSDSLQSGMSQSLNQLSIGNVGNMFSSSTADASALPVAAPNSMRADDSEASMPAAMPIRRVARDVATDLEYYTYYT
jgi:serine/threonine protein kinase